MSTKEVLGLFEELLNRKPYNDEELKYHSNKTTFQNKRCEFLQCHEFQSKWHQEECKNVALLMANYPQDVKKFVDSLQEFLIQSNPNTHFDLFVLSTSVQELCNINIFGSLIKKFTISKLQTFNMLMELCSEYKYDSYINLPSNLLFTRPLILYPMPNLTMMHSENVFVNFFTDVFFITDKNSCDILSQQHQKQIIDTNFFINNQICVFKDTAFNQSFPLGRFIIERFEILKKPQIVKSGNFSNINYYCPIIKPKTFQQMIAIQAETKEIIAASNSFLTDEIFIGPLHKGNEEYEKTYGIFGGLLHSFQLVQEKPIQEIIKERIIMVSNSFTGTNSGHDLGTLLATLLYIRENKLDEHKLGIQELAFKFPRILEILELFYCNNNWNIFQSDVLYHFDSVDFIIVSSVFVVSQYKKPKVKELIEEIKTKSFFNMIEQGANPPKGAKIILLKRTHNTNTRSHDAFQGAEFFAQMNEDGWIVLNPEYDDMRYMISLLATASKILVSYGAIMWTHMLFFNRDATIIHLEVDGEIAYAPLQTEFSKNLKKLIITDTHLDHDVNKDLIDKIKNL